MEPPPSLFSATDYAEPWRIVAGDHFLHVYDSEHRHVAVVYDNCDEHDAGGLLVAAINACQGRPLDELERVPSPDWGHRPGPLHTSWRVGTGRGHYETIFGHDAPGTGLVASTDDRGPASDHPAGIWARRIVACTNAFVVEAPDYIRAELETSLYFAEVAALARARGCRLERSTTTGYILWRSGLGWQHPTLRSALNSLSSQPTIARF